MPLRIPSQDTFSVLPGVRQGQVEPGFSVEQAQYAGRQAQRFGQAVSGVGLAMTDVVLAEQQKANKLRLNDAFNQASEIALQLRLNKDTGYTRLKGGDAMKGVNNKPIADHYTDELEKRLGEIAEGLGNQQVREEFEYATSELRQKFRNDALSYEAEQANVYAEQVRDATLVLAQNELVADPFGKGSRLSVLRAQAAATDKARAAGLDGDALKLAVQTQMGKVHEGVVQSLLDAQQSGAAATYFEQHRGDFTEIDAKTVKARIDIAQGSARAVAAVDEAFEAFPVETNGSLRKSEMDKYLREKFKGDGEALKAARAELSQRVQDWEFQENEDNAVAVNEVLDRLNGGSSLAAVRSSPAWARLSGKDRDQITRMILERGRSDAANEIDDLPDEVAIEAGMLLANPDELMRMTPAQLQAKLPYYGRALTNQLIQKRGELAKAGALADAKLDADLFNAAAENFGLKPFSSNHQDKAKVARVRSRIETILAQEQRQKGRSLTLDEKRALIARETASQVLVGNKKRPLAALTPEQAAKIKIKGADRTVVVNALEQMYNQTGDERYAPTEENVRRMYLELFDSGQFFVDE